MKILFVCTGNTCRSPMAECIFRDMLKKDGNENIMCQSAGLSAINGSTATENAILACKELGLDISGHVSRRFSQTDLKVWDVFFTMSKTHGYILEQAGVPKDKIYVPSYIDDPFGGNIEEYRACRDKIKIELEEFYSRLKVFMGNQL